MITLLESMTRGSKNTHRQKGAIRIISGQWRGRKLPVLNAEGLRPTTDRIKETLFNWLMHDIRANRCLDLFAGSGGLAFEALSRYAAFVTLVELDKRNAQQLKDNLALLKVGSDQAEVIQGDALQVLGQLNTPYDVVFLDPPFQKGLLPKAINQLNEAGMISDNGLVYIECEADNADYAVPTHWHLLKQSNSRQVDYRVYQVQEA